jgi:hypothetical protein
MSMRSGIGTFVSMVAGWLKSSLVHYNYHIIELLRRICHGTWLWGCKYIHTNQNKQCRVLVFLFICSRSTTEESLRAD